MFQTWVFKLLYQYFKCLLFSLFGLASVQNLRKEASSISKTTDNVSQLVASWQVK